MIALVVAGLMSGFLEVRSWQALWHTTYGQLLLVKVALLVPLLALGAFNNRISVPRLRSAAAGPQVRRRFARSVALELALMIVIVGVTAALVAEPPAKAQVAAAVPSLETARSVPTTSRSPSTRPASGRTRSTSTCSTPRASPQRLTRSGCQPRCPRSTSARFSSRRPRPAPATSLATAELPLAGDWQLQLDVREGEFDQWSTVTDLPIRKDS